jgi:hypothetical protein
MSRRILLAACVGLTACADDEFAELIDRGCADFVLDSVDGIYATRTDSGCFPTIDEQTPVGECTGLLEGLTPNVVFTWHGLFAGCPACDAGFTPSDCRPLVCAADNECPWFLVPDGDSDDAKAIVFECVNGLCQNTDPAKRSPDEIDAQDAQLACLADVEREDGEYEGESWCPDDGDTCPLPLPDACRQP